MMIAGTQNTKVEFRIKTIPECRKSKIRKWDDTYETVRNDIADGILAVGGKGASKNTYTKEEVDAMFADVGQAVKDLLKTVSRLEKELAKSKGK